MRVTFAFITFFMNLTSLFAQEQLLNTAIEGKGCELLNIFLKYGGDPNFPPLHQALRKKDLDSAIILIHYGVDVNKRPAKFTKRLIGNRGWFADAAVDRQTALESQLKKTCYILYRYY